MELPLAGGVFFSIYTFQTESDNMALTFSLRCGMLIVRFWTVCLFFIYFLNVPFTALYQMGVLEGRSFLFSLGAPRNWQISPYPKGSTSLVEKKAEEPHSVSAVEYFCSLFKGGCKSCAVQS
jgi:hypothetical protein